ncbi:metal ABC transporter permease [Mycobacterium sherrisii]|uniref:ABC transporter n=1 Tax=Mycobacterium sherrisii TaxID=243061 RepID=A0A1E3T7R6_9MYCO|nr:metal ABC transporter permease [Mycobacterium sherrisii]MCV7028984.1 metal ABC transporter permease [Mycobacterium sherrisii]MEC4763153.1 metal ABC transporter permease [Mycobacterium sherrisii]ODR10432.1 ABC transporter [Mycobacterium sherrisii]ORW75757.1 ABC transporter [Mycobacterium sherrisii]
MIAQPGWNVIADVQQMWVYPFMVTAFRAGTVVAVLAGVVGWIMVLRKESFAGHTLAIVGFPGAAAAAWLGIATGYGYFAASVGAAAVIALLPRSTRAGTLSSLSEESAGIGTIQALALATGFLFVSLYHGFLSGLTNLLFGAITGVTTGQLGALMIAALVCLVVLAAIGRPLLWASIDPDAATANGVPTRGVAMVFLLVLGAATAGASQITGSLLVFVLLVAPPAAAFQLTARPVTGIVLSIVLAVTVTWLGIGCAFYSPYPIGFWVSSFAFAGYLLAVGYRTAAERALLRVDRQGIPARPVVTA